MRKWTPAIVIMLLALLSSAATAAVGLEAYLALTGLDLLVTAKKTAPQLAVILAIVSFVLWITAIIVLVITMRKNKRTGNN